jgi:hypothetical protein
MRATARGDEFDRSGVEFQLDRVGLVAASDAGFDQAVVVAEDRDAPLAGILGPAGLRLLREVVSAAKRQEHIFASLQREWWCAFISAAREKYALPTRFFQPAAGHFALGPGTHVALSIAIPQRGTRMAPIELILAD